MASALDDAWSEFSVPTSISEHSFEHIGPDGSNSAGLRDQPESAMSSPNEDDPALGSGWNGIDHLKRSARFGPEPQDMICVVAEDTVFNIYTFVFKRDSEPFRKLLAAHTKDAHIFLPDTTATDLERFLDLLYPINFGHYADKTFAEWMSILRVAYLWQFRSIYWLAVRYLDAITSPVDKIICARTLGAHVWLVDAYAALCERKEALTQDECRRLGVDEVACIYDAREGARSSQGELTDLVLEKLELHGRLPQVIRKESELEKKRDRAPEAWVPSPVDISSMNISPYQPAYVSPSTKLFDDDGNCIAPSSVDTALFCWCTHRVK